MDLSVHLDRLPIVEEPAGKAASLPSGTTLSEPLLVATSGGRGLMVAATSGGAVHLYDVEDVDTGDAESDDDLEQESDDE